MQCVCDLNVGPCPIHHPGLYSQYLAACGVDEPVRTTDPTLADILKRVQRIEQMLQAREEADNERHRRNIESRLRF